MELQVETFVKKPIFVGAIQVTTENMEALSDWCGGVVKLGDGTKHYIKVPVVRPAKKSQTMAFVGDWLLSLGKSFKVYTDQGFWNSFERPIPLEGIQIRLHECEGIDF